MTLDALDHTYIEEELIDESEEEFEPLTDIPLDNRRITCEQVDFTIQNLYSLAQDGDLNLQPDFQRNSVWNKVKASRLIESVLINVPIPVIYLAEENDGILSVVDGQQRLTSLIDYLKGLFKLRKMSILQELNGNKFSELEPEYQRRIRNTPLRCIVIKRESHPDIKFEIFERINTGSVKLNEQELRNCIYRGTINRLLKELAEDRDWKNIAITNKDKERMKDREMILRFIALYSSYNRYGSSLKQFLNRFMEENKNASLQQINEFRAVFKKSLALTKLVFGDKAFKRFSLGDSDDPNGKWEEVINKAIFDAVMLGFVPYEQNQVVPKADYIRDQFIDMMTTNIEFVDAISSNTGDRRRVRTRIDLWANQMRNIMNESTNTPRNYPSSFRRDLFAQDPTCEICSQRIMLFEDTSIDHGVPYSRGGATTPGNGRLAHRYCNTQRGNRV